MERFTISLPTDLALAFDGWLTRRGYTTRSEAVRDLVRSVLDADHATASADGVGIGALSYVYDHHDHTLTARLAEAQHDHHDLVVSTLHAHLDHERCLEVSILRGSTAAVQSLANAITAQRGIRHGHLHFIATDAGRPAWTPAPWAVSPLYTKPLSADRPRENDTPPLQNVLGSATGS